MRIARDLHDVVAHNISVINVQANTALHLMDRQPDRARTAPTTINEVSGQALAELRSVLGVLRAVDESEPRAPAPGLARLGDQPVLRAPGHGRRSAPARHDPHCRGRHTACRHPRRPEPGPPGPRVRPRGMIRRCWEP